MTITKHIIWSPSSEKDFESILEYLYIRWNRRVILKFINKVDDAIDLISENPKLFPLINEELQIRKCVITKQNTLFYREVNKNIEVVRLFDSRQDPKKLNF